MVSIIDKGHIEVDKIYWYYNATLSRNKNRVIYYLKPAQVVLKELITTTFNVSGVWEVLEDNLSSKKRFDYQRYLNGWFPNSYLFDTESECKKHHDDRLIEWATAGSLNTNDQNLMFKKLFSPRPDKPQVEVDAVSWMEDLPLNERKHVKWLIDNYRGKINLKNI